MKIAKLYAPIVTAALALFLAATACGGGEEKTTPTPPAIAGTFGITVSVSPEGAGTVEVLPAADQQGKYRSGTNLLLIASANAGFQFLSWAGSVGGRDNPLSVTMTSEMSVLAVFTSLPATPTPTATPLPAREGSVAFYDCFDFETGQAIRPETPTGDCPAETDFSFAYNATRVPHAVIFQNQSQGVQIAYTSEDFLLVDWSDVAALSFSTALVDVPFDQVAVLRTAQGNYYKMTLLSEEVSSVLFQWLPLAPP